jgi:hypothetical protein
MSHHCALCGRIVFKTFHEYEIHRLDFHGIRAQARPLNVTGRSKEQIVREAEASWLRPYIVPTGREAITHFDNTEHLDACRCNACFQRALDKLVIESEKALQS